jgi:hypothetical protein
MKPASPHRAAKKVASTSSTDRGSLIAAFYAAPDDALFKQDTVAAVLGRSEAWCEAIRSKGGGPKFKRLSARNILYPKRAVLTWLSQFKECESTSQYA